MQNDDKEQFKREFIKRLIVFTITVIRLSDKIKSQRNLWSVSDQLIRSSASVGANVVEAKSASSNKDYIKFFEIALKSANETLYWLIVLKECINQEYRVEVEKIYKEAEEISKILGSSVLTLKGKKK